MEDNGKFVWLLAGAAIGATVALLYAPQSGKDTRRIIRKKTAKVERARGKQPRSDGQRPRLYEKGLRVADEAAELIERGRKIVEG